MKYTEQDYKDEYEQAVKRKGKLYAEGYVEGLRDAHNQALSMSGVVGRSEQLKAFAVMIAQDDFAYLKSPEELLEDFKRL